MPRLRQPKEQAPPASLRFQQEEDPRAKKDGLFEQEQENEDSAELEAEKKAEQDAADELKKQIEALKRAEQEQRNRADRAERERREALEAAKAKDVEVQKAQDEIVQSRADVINKAIEKETEAAEAAERDLEQALSNGDASAAAKAQRRISQAEAKLVTLQNGKDAIEAEIAEAKNRPAPKEEPKPQNQTVEQAIDSWNVPDTAKRWLKAHPEYITDNRKNAKIQSLHWDVLDEGHAPFSEAYYTSLETHLGLREKPKKEEPVEEEEESRSSVVSAPVSREAPANNGSRSSGLVRLTPAQREAAKMAGITETEYAKQFARLKQEKENGSYGEQR